MTNSHRKTHATYISLLRGINVSGQKLIRMDALRKVYEDLKLSNVETYVQSGNILFDCASQDAAGLAKRLEAKLASAFGYSVRVFLRDRDEFQRIVAANPFLKNEVRRCRRTSRHVSARGAAARGTEFIEASRRR